MDDELRIDDMMVGDWYRNIEFDDCRQWTPNDYMDTNVAYCKAIRLTEDIIKRNGLRYKNIEIGYDGYEISIDASDGCFLLCVTVTYDGAYSWNIEDMPIYHVNELQKILRSIGLVDIANNITVS